MRTKQHEWLLNLSFMLTLLLEVLPAEMDTLTTFTLHGRLDLFIVTKLVALIVILLPLVVYFHLRSKMAVEERPIVWTGRLVAIVIILSLNLFVNLGMIVSLVKKIPS